MSRSNLDFDSEKSCRRNLIPPVGVTIGSETIPAEDGITGAGMGRYFSVDVKATSVAKYSAKLAKVDKSNVDSDCKKMKSMVSGRLLILQLFQK